MPEGAALPGELKHFLHSIDQGSVVKAKPTQQTGPAQQETMDPGSFPCLRPVWTFLHNLLVPVVPSNIPCTCSDFVPMQCA